VNKDNIARKISKILETRGMTQKDLAELAGISRAAVNALLTGKHGSKHLIHTIASSLNIDYEYLIEESSQFYEDLDVLLLSDCMAIVAQIIDQNNFQVTHYNDVVKLALELYKWHQKGKVDIRKQEKEAIAYAEGIINYQFTLGLIKLKNQDE
jgi:transcriptional regulator with XRE-family HTH domain